MKYDVFEFHGAMTTTQILWRAALLVIIITVALCDLFIWRP
jgi:hypothetical protein